MAYEKIKATASVTIVDETDASMLTGNMLVVKGSKNQIYITGQANPFSPDWSKSNLVIRPFLQASNVTKIEIMLGMVVSKVELIVDTSEVILVNRLTL